MQRRPCAVSGVAARLLPDRRARLDELLQELNGELNELVSLAAYGAIKSAILKNTTRSPLPLPGEG